MTGREGRVFLESMVVLVPGRGSCVRRVVGELGKVKKGGDPSKESMGYWDVTDVTICGGYLLYHNNF